jgi:hypothetical protein
MSVIIQKWDRTDKRKTATAMMRFFRLVAGFSVQHEMGISS